MEPHSVAVRVPATTGNLGPGFDALGMALDIWNSIIIRRSERASVTISGTGESDLSRGKGNLIYRAAARVFQEQGLAEPRLSISCRNAIPLGRGLGSSAAAAVGGLVAANALCGDPLSQSRLLDIAASLEGHPDNVAPALLGGCQIVVRSNSTLIASSVPIPTDLKCVLFVPDRPMPTTESRAALPKRVSREDAIYNVGRTALLVNALTTGRLEDLRIATQDRLHQPVRLKIFPPAKHVIRAALDAGALGVFLSGGGSSVLALALEHEMTIGYEMANAGDKLGAPGEVVVTRPSQAGAEIVKVE